MRVKFVRNILIFATLVASATAQVTSISLDEGDIFPEIMFTTVDGELLTTEKLSGKVVFYNFYFAACPPCIAQKSGLNALHDRFRANDDVVFISVTFDNYETIKQFQETHGKRFKVVSTNRNEIRRFAVGAYPTNILVGVDGKVVLKMVGGRGNRVRNQFSAAIQSELRKI